MTDNNKLITYYSFSKIDSNRIMKPSSENGMDSLPVPVKEVLDSIVDIVMKQIEFQAEFTKLFYETYKYIWIIHEKQTKLSKTYMADDIYKKRIFLSFESAEKTDYFLQNKSLLNIYQCKNEISTNQIIGRFLQSDQLTSELMNIAQKMIVFQQLFCEKSKLYKELLRDHQKYIWIQESNNSLYYSSYSNALTFVSNPYIIQKNIMDVIDNNIINILNMDHLYHISKSDISLL